MNERMYVHPATQANLEALKARGVTIVPPGEGELASHGEHGVGRLAEPAELLAVTEALLAARRGSWAGLRVLVTAGGTREPIDSVRYIGNRSSGRMGFALASEAAMRGAAVTLVAANTGLAPPPGTRVIEVGTAAELGQACDEEFDVCDVLLMAAAVADFRPASPAHDKLKKEAGVPAPIELEPTEDVLSGLGARKRSDQILVGFAALFLSFEPVWSAEDAQAAITRPRDARSGSLLFKTEDGYVDATRLGVDVDLTVSGPTIRARVTLGRSQLGRL